MATRHRKSRRSCKHGKLKKPVRTKNGGKRRCKKSKSKSKSKRKSRSKRKSKRKYKMLSRVYKNIFGDTVAVEVEKPVTNTVVYTEKNNHTEEGPYYIVKNIEYGYHPLANHESFGVTFKEFGQDHYITSVQLVDSDGNPIGEPINPHGDTATTFLKRMKVYRRL